MSVVALVTSLALIAVKVVLYGAGGLFSLLLIGAVVWQYKRDQSYKHPRAPPVVGKLPLLGCTLDLIKDPFALMKKCQKELGDVYTFRLLAQDIILLCDTKYCQRYFKATETQLSFLQTTRENSFDLFFGDELYSNPIHSTIIKTKLIPRLKDFTPALQTELEGLLAQRLGDGATFADLETFTYPLVTTLNCRCLVGEEAYNNKDLLKAFIDLDYWIEHTVLLFRVIPSFLHTFMLRPIHKQFATIADVLVPVIEERRRTGKQGHDLLQDLINHEQNMDAKFLSSRVGIVVWASLVTTANILTQVVYDLAARPEIYNRVMNEQREIIRASGDEITNETLSKMLYLDMCIRESLRMAVGPFGSSRVAMQDFAVEDTPDSLVIPKGATVVLANYLIHYNPEIWPEPEKYDPTRFEDPKKAGGYEWLPFGNGIHACPGRSFAFHIIKMSVVNLLRNYEVKLAGPRPSYRYKGFHLKSDAETTTFTRKKISV